jgi:hypothetical protein
VITTPTVFVLGAGASKPYGFLTGAELAQTIVSALLNAVNSAPVRLGPDTLAGRLTARVSPSQFDPFVRDFLASGRSSLDAFVNSRPDYLELVKYGIVLALAGCEREGSLFPHNDDDWYQYLFDHIIPAKAEAFTANQLRVITFNFDRSFERRLFLALKASFNLSDADAAGLGAHVPVLHLHGQLGHPSWCSIGTPVAAYRPYESASITDEQLVACVHEIRIIHEEITDSALRTAQEWLRTAAQIAFLGFGFHPINLARLAVQEIDGTLVRGTALGFTKAELAPIKRAFSKTTPELYLGLGCRQLLRETDIIHG